MIPIILVIHLLVAISLVTAVLLQRSEGGGLGIGGGGGGGLMTGRAGANLLTRTTAVLGAVFFCTSLVLAILAAGTSGPRSIMETDRPGVPTEPARPAAPVAQ
jgi:preprotein translocase subunit SecG